jgi:hypothetical protein
MKVLGVGLSRTGTTSLHDGLRILGFKSLHFDQVRLKDILDGSNPRPDFRRYDDVDAVLDLPAAYFYDELTAAYPGCRCILTVRSIEEWWKSVSRWFSTGPPVSDSDYSYVSWRVRKRLYRAFKKEWRYLQPDDNRFRRQLRNLVYGSATAHEYLYKKRFIEHNERVVRRIPPERLLVMDITAGDGWDKLCPFLDVPVPSVPFPHLNKGALRR